MLPTDSLHLLTIDLERASTPLFEAFRFSTQERRELLLDAGKDDIPLVLLASSRTMHLVSTSRNHVRAFRPTLARVHERTLASEGSRTVPVRVSRGGDAARQFLRHATAFAQRKAEATQFLCDLRDAAQLSISCNAFGAELAALLRMTEYTARRIDTETRLGRPGTAEAEIELETLAAERIVEEEILVWQSSHPAHRASVRPPLSELFSAEEPQSMVRRRGAGVLAKLRTA